MTNGLHIFPSLVKKKFVNDGELSVNATSVENATKINTIAIQPVITKESFFKATNSLKAKLKLKGWNDFQTQPLSCHLKLLVIFTFLFFYKREKQHRVVDLPLFGRQNGIIGALGRT